MFDRTSLATTWGLGVALLLASSCALSVAAAPPLAATSGPAPASLPQATAPLPAGSLPKARSPENEVRILVVADRESALSAPVPGRIATISVRLGDSVGSGQLVASFDCDEIIARRAAARAELKSARLQHEAKIKLQGLQSAAEVEVELAAANADKAEAQLRVFDAQLAQCRFTAPFRAKVARIHVKQGQSVAAGAPIMDLVASDSLRAKLNVPSRWLAWLKVGDHLDAEIDETGHQYKLRVSRFAARVDAVSQTVEVEADFEGKTADLLPGMSGLARTPLRP